MVRPTRVMLMSLLLWGFTAGAAADQWNDRTTIKFDAPVMVPGATLAPGTYVFKLADVRSNRHTVQIFNENETQIMATALAVPMKRMDAKGDVVVKMNPTEAGAPLALKGWFYPGSLYGHEFVYPDEQAREIAERTKTLVLSSDVAGSDMQGGKLYTYDAEGRQGAWHEDAMTIKEWQSFVQQRGASATAKVAAPGTPENRETTAPAVRNAPQGMEVELSKLEENPQQYTGKTITVTGEVGQVRGPRLFTLDEPAWADLDREVLVYLPSDLAALVREDDRVTVTGTVKTFDRPEVEREQAGLGWDAESPAEIVNRPMLVASSIVGGDSNVALAIDVKGRRSESEGTVGTSGTTGTSGSSGATETTGDRSDRPITDPGELSSAGEDTIGRRIRFDAAKVSRAGQKHGFWIGSGNRVVFVVPAQQQESKPGAGQSVSIEGLVLAMPQSLRDAAGSADNANTDIYIYATDVS